MQTTIPPFWTPEQTREAQRIHRNHELWEGEHKAQLHTADGGWKWPLYVFENWLRRTSDNWAALVWGTPPTFSCANEADTATWQAITEAVALDMLLTPAQQRISYAGAVALKLAWGARTGKPTLRVWGTQHGESVAWEQEPGASQAHAVAFYMDEVRTDPRNPNAKLTIRRRERYELIDGEVFVANDAYECRGGNEPVVKPDARWPMARLYPDMDAADLPPDETTLTAFSVLPGFRVQNGVDDESDYTPSLIAIQKALTGVHTQRQIAVLISTLGQLIVPQDTLNPDGTLDLAKFLVTTYEPGEDPQARTLIVNTAGNSFNLEHSAAQIAIYEAAYYRETGLSPAFDGVAQGAGAESGYARRLGLYKPDVHVAWRRRAWNGFWGWLAVAVPELCQAEGAPIGSPLSAPPVATWQSIVPDDPNEVSERTERAKRGGYMSLEEAVAEEHADERWTPEQVAEEVARIRADEDRATALAVPTFAMPGGGDTAPVQ
jgi:hypothetical protein